MNENNIGQPGQNLNFSVASRAINIEPDGEQIERYDEFPAQANAMQYVFMVLAFVVLGAAVYFLKSGSWIIGVAGIVVAFIFAMLSYSSGKATLRKEIAYSTGLIVPAIITNTSPIELIALADMSTAEEQEPIYGCLKMQVGSLPNHKIEVGEKVPCVSLFGVASQGYRRHFQPRPVCWGFKDPKVITAVIQSISDSQDNANVTDEWQTLGLLQEQMKAATPDEVVFFDKELQKVNM